MKMWEVVGERNVEFRDVKGVANRKFIDVSDWGKAVKIENWLDTMEACLFG